MQVTKLRGSVMSPCMTYREHLASQPLEVELSVVAPMHNEAGGAHGLASEISAAVGDLRHEIIFVNDASTDDTEQILEAAQHEFSQLRVISHEKKAGQSRALRTGILAARASVIVTLDGDGQNDPADIPALYRRLKEQEGSVGMVAGERRERRDATAKKFASSIANGVRKSILNDGADDTGCGLKVFHREAFLRLPYFDHLHRYLPAMMSREGYSVVFEPVAHRPRRHGASKYTNFGRLGVAVRDLIGVTWLLARSKSPGEITEKHKKKGF